MPLSHDTGPRALGLDFGTTNTVLSWAHPHAPADPVVFRYLSSLLFSFRSALCFWNEGDDDHPKVMSDAGPWAIQRFIEFSGDCRFIQSLKTFAASRLFEQTYIFGRAWRFEDLFREFFDEARRHAHPQLDHLPRDVLVGRPVEYAGSRPDAALARQRYEAALGAFRLSSASARCTSRWRRRSSTRRSLEDSATVLVADFGGGTTDFSVIHFEHSPAGPARRGAGAFGCGVAGDRFDYRIIDNVVLPRLGQGHELRSVGKSLEMPRSASRASPAGTSCRCSRPRATSATSRRWRPSARRRSW
jgi:hypothetical chaperone protein